MNPQAYELWLEQHSGRLRLNPRWDAYDRLALDLFRAKKKDQPVQVMEFGNTPKVADWAKDRCFTMQMAWMAEQGFANCLSIVSEKERLFKLGVDFPKVWGFMPAEEIVNEWFDTIFYRRFDCREADLVLIGESHVGAYDWSKLKQGCLVALDQDQSLIGPWDNAGFKQIFRGALTIWKKA